MIPDVTITCRGKVMSFDSVSVRQYKKYVSLMDSNESESAEDILFYQKKMLQAMYKNKISLAQLGHADIVEFMAAAKATHFIMQEIVSQKLLSLTEAETVEKEESAFDEYDEENGYEDEQPEKSIWQSCGEIVDQIIKTSIRLLKNSYSQCMDEDIIDLLDYLKFELDTLNET